MISHRRRQRVGVGALALVACMAPIDAQAQWTVVNLHPTGAVESRSFGTYQSQQVGEADFGTSHASQWSGASSTWTDLHPSGTSSGLVDTFERHHVGTVQISGSGHASLWSGSPLAWVDLHPASATFSSAERVGGHSAFPGLIRQVGGAFVAGVHRASMWTGSAASWVDLHPAAATFSIAYDVDDDEQVGMAIIGGSPTASLWNGTSASWTSLHPVGGVTSTARGVHGGKQVGSVDVGASTFHASLWSGTAASWVDLHPAAGSSSEAHNIMGSRQVGEVRVGGIAHASVWSGTAATWVDLHPVLGPQYIGGSSAAYGIWIDGATTYVAGYAFNTTLSQYEAILWVETSPPGNDDCVSAQSILSGTTLFSNVGATTDGPAEPTCPPPSFNGIDDSDVWFEYVALCEGNVSFEVFPGNFDTLLGVYSGICGGLLLDCGSASLGGPHFATSVPAIPGENFIVRLGGIPGAQGVSSIKAQCIPSIGACCESTGVCTQGAPSACQSVGGTYLGDGTTCAPLTCPPPAPQIDFASPSAVGTGSFPVAVAAGDFDKDGDNDLAVCDLTGQTVTVLQNNGSGTFQFSYALSMGNVSQQDLVAADLDSDGDLDLAIAAEAVVLVRNVNGALGSWITHTIGAPDVRSIMAEDFDGDCTVDLATANPNAPGNSVAVLLNVNGDFTAPTVTHYSAGSNPIDLASADVDQDGDMDIVVANASSGDLTVLYNNGAGSFATSITLATGLGGCCLTGIAAGDLNGDLYPDVVITDSNSTRISVMYNDGVGSFSTPVVMSVGNSPWDVKIADLDGDDDNDIVIAITNFPYQIMVLTNDGSGGLFSPRTFNVGAGPQKVVVAHLDGMQDGAIDVAVPSSGPDEVSVLLNVSNQDCNANAMDDDTESQSALNFVITGTSNATPCSFRAYGTGFDVQGEFCAPSGAGGESFVEDAIARLNEAACPGIRAERINGLPNGFTVRAPGSSLDFCIGSAPGPATCCFSSTSVCSCNPDIEEFFFSGKDCNANGMDDTIDLYVGTSTDLDGNGIPDQCEGIPSVSEWGLTVMVLLLLIAGTAVLRPQGFTG